MDYQEKLISTTKIYTEIIKGMSKTIDYLINKIDTNDIEMQKTIIKSMETHNNLVKQADTIWEVNCDKSISKQIPVENKSKINFEYIVKRENLKMEIDKALDEQNELNFVELSSQLKNLEAEEIIREFNRDFNKFINEGR